MMEQGWYNTIVDKKSKVAIKSEKARGMFKGNFSPSSEYIDIFYA